MSRSTSERSCKRVTWTGALALGAALCSGLLGLTTITAAAADAATAAKPAAAKTAAAKQKAAAAKAAAAKRAASAAAPQAATTEPAAALGLPSALTLASTTPKYTVAIPALAGERVTGLTVNVYPHNTSGAVITATDASGTVLGRISASGGPRRWAIPLHARPGALYYVTFAVTGTGSAACATSAVPNVGLQLLDVFGVRTPLTAGGSGTAIAALNGPTEHVTLRVAAPVTRSEAQLALQLTTEIVASDPDRNVTVSVQSSGTPAQLPTALERVITLSPSSGPGAFVSRGNAVTISGDLSTFLSGAGASSLDRLLTPSDSVAAYPDAGDGEATLTQLGAASIRHTAAGFFTLPFTLSQQALGQMVSSLRATFTGTATVPAGSRTTLTLFSGNRRLRSQTLTASGPWSLSAGLPTNQLDTTGQLLVQVNTEAPAHCTAAPVATVTLDPNHSSLKWKAGNPPAATFLQSAQALLPATQVVLPDQSIAGLGLTAQLVAGLQREESRPLKVTVAPTGKLPAHGTAILVLNGRDPAAGRLRPQTVRNGSALFTYGPHDTIGGVMSTAAVLRTGRLPSGDRYVALLGPTGRGTTSAQLLTALGTDPGTWYSLGGDTVGVTSGGDIVHTTVAPPTVPTKEAVARWWVKIWWFDLMVGLTLVAAAIAAVFMLRDRRAA